jgi:hypothetical protein
LAGRISSKGCTPAPCRFSRRTRPFISARKPILCTWKLPGSVQRVVRVVGLLRCRIRGPHTMTLNEHRSDSNVLDCIDVAPYHQTWTIDHQNPTHDTPGGRLDDTLHGYICC